MRQVFSHHPGPRSFLEKTHDVTVVGECWDATKYGVGRQDRLYQCLEESGKRPPDGPAAYIDGDGQDDLAGHGGEHQAVLFIKSSPTTIGSADSVETSSPTGSSARTLQSRACLTETYASAIATGLGKALFEVTQPAGHLPPRWDPHERAAYGRVAGRARQQ